MERRTTASVLNDPGTLLSFAAVADVKVTLYTTDPCGFCTAAKALLHSRGVAYREVNLAKDPGGRASLMALTGQMTFPQVVIGERSIGGFRELIEADRDGMLQDLLAA